MRRTVELRSSGKIHSGTRASRSSARAKGISTFVSMAAARRAPRGRAARRMSSASCCPLRTARSQASGRRRSPGRAPAKSRAASSMRRAGELDGRTFAVRQGTRGATPRSAAQVSAVAAACGLDGSSRHGRGGHHLLVEGLGAVAVPHEQRGEAARLALEAPFAGGAEKGERRVGRVGEGDFAGARRVGQVRVGIGGEVDRVRREVGPRAEGVSDADAHAVRRQGAVVRDGRRTGMPGDVCDDTGVGGVAPVPVRGPVRRTHVNLHVAADPAAVVADFQHGVSEIRPGFEIPAPGIDHAYRRAARRAQLAGAQRRVVPDGLNVPLGDDVVVSVHKPSIPFCSDGKHDSTSAVRGLGGKLSNVCNRIVCEFAHGGTGETRTPNPRFRKPVLCPVELLSRIGRRV